MITLTDKLKTEKPKIEIYGKEYEVNNSVKAVLQFNELSNSGDIKHLVGAIEATLGEEAVKELDLENWPFENFKVLNTGIMATIEGISYEEVEARFQEK